jgi:chromosome segregation ATPase
LAQNAEELISKVDRLATENAELTLLKADKDRFVHLEEKNRKEIERLRKHLIEVNESHTNEVLILEDKINDLQDQLEKATKYINELDMMLSSTENQNTSNVEQELALLRQELDNKIKENETNITALMDLQMVMEQIQRGKNELYVSNY